MEAKPKPADNESRPNRRRDKVTTACEACRVRKRKCCGSRPRCTACRHSGIPCQWPRESRRSTNISSDYVRQLESRLNNLENQRQHTRSRASELTQPRKNDLDQQKYFLAAAKPGDDMRDKLPPVEHDDVSWPQSTTVDAALGRLQSNVFFGTANIGNFVSTILRTMESERETPEDVQPFAPDGPNAHAPIRRSREKFYGSALPSRKTADSLLSVYFRYIHPIFPFLDQVEISHEYQSLWTGADSRVDDELFMYTLNLMFALSARLSVDIAPGERDDVAKTFYDRAVKAMSEEIWRHSSFRSIQALLLLGQYWHTKDAHQCWMAVSMAVRMAQGFGLHLPETSERLPSMRTRTLARRVWYGCVMMDRILAMTFGRPAIVSSDAAAAVPKPAAMKDDALHGFDPAVNRPGSHSPSVMDFFIESIKLYEILNDILTSASSSPYHRELEHSIFSSTKGTHKSILILDHHLAKFRDDLPPHLTHSKSDLYGDVFARQAVMMRQRYLHMRTILLRPTLCQLLQWQKQPQNQSDSFNHKKLHSDIIRQCALACVDTAIESIKLIRECGPSDPSEVGLLHIWSYNLLYLYTAATVVIALRHCQSIDVDVSRLAATAAMTDAMAVLETYCQYGPSAQRLRDILKTIDQRLSLWVARQFPAQTSHVAPDSVASGPIGALPPFAEAHPDDFPSYAAVIGMDDSQLPLFDMQDLSWLNEFPLLIES